MVWKIETDNENCLHLQQSFNDNTLLICGHIENYLHDCLESLCPLNPANSAELCDTPDSECRCLECGEVGKHLFGCKMPKFD